MPNVVSAYSKPWGIRGNRPYFIGVASDDVQEVEFDSWWEIHTDKESLRGYSWEGKKFESRIQAKHYLLKHKNEISSITDAQVICKTK